MAAKSKRREGGHNVWAIQRKISGGARTGKETKGAPTLPLFPFPSLELEEEEEEGQSTWAPFASLFCPRARRLVFLLWRELERGACEVGAANLLFPLLRSSGNCC